MKNTFLRAKTARRIRRACFIRNLDFKTNTNGMMIIKRPRTGKIMIVPTHRVPAFRFSEDFWMFWMFLYMSMFVPFAFAKHIPSGGQFFVISSIWLCMFLLCMLFLLLREWSHASARFGK